ncbi:MAG: hypothetical protein IEMM0008_1209 [bacterium]|nr:MAG: hypothetical protein IEMM0008_1209 [bacterium]
MVLYKYFIKPLIKRVISKMYSIVYAKLKFNFIYSNKFWLNMDSRLVVLYLVWRAFLNRQNVCSTPSTT